MPSARSLLLLLPASVAACDAPDPSPAAPATPSADVEPAVAAPAPIPGVSAPDVARPAGVEATTVAGAVLRAELGEEHLSGFPVVVNLELRNPTAAALAVPDLSTRRHLVHFKLESPSGTVTERFSTPPEFDTGGSWTIPAGSRRSIRFEIPSSRALEPGRWKLTVLAGEPGAVTPLPEHSFSVVPARPVAGRVVYEPVIAANSGAIFAWLHQGSSGYEVYLDQLSPGAGTSLVARARVSRLEEKAEPQLARALPAAARSRHVYWWSGASQLAYSRVDGLANAAPARPIDMPWPRVEPLARGATTASGALIVPVWIPGPTGVAGEVKLVQVDERGKVDYRPVADSPARPSRAETALDASGNLVLALASEAGIDIYRVDGKRPSHLPAAGKRAWAREGEWSTVALAFDTLPESGSFPGGLGLVALQLATTTDVEARQPTTVSRLVSFDLGSKPVTATPPLPWSAPGQVTAILPAGAGPLRYLATAPDGTTWFGVYGTGASAIGHGLAGELWPGATPAEGELRSVDGDRAVARRLLSLAG
ncbi:MAG: hypothetical protein FJ102_01080 [Deltaproteobacteria bacterium]|nr:hypothetical protein [Deltaproteobacteria bacterium]